MKNILLFITANLAFAAASSLAVMPPPDGGYPGENTAEGKDALFRLTTGPGNTAIGFRALARTTSRSANTALGDRALEDNVTGVDNTAIGALALSATTGSENVGVGASTMENNATGDGNVAVGSFALTFHSGDNNTAIGFRALGSSSASSGSNNIALGALAGALLESGDNNIYIGNSSGLSESNTMRIGDGISSTYIGGIYNMIVPDGIAVLIHSDGHLGTTTSSARFKDQVQSMDKASEAIFSLRPVNFRYKEEFDPAGIPQFGLVAEEVEKVSAFVTVHDCSP